MKKEISVKGFASPYLDIKWVKTYQGNMLEMTKVWKEPSRGMVQWVITARRKYVKRKTLER